jgi:hypothetical protein
MSIFDPPWVRNSEATIVRLVADELRKKVCMAVAPDRSGRTCDKPKGHDGDHCYRPAKLVLRVKPQPSLTGKHRND